MKQFIWNWKFKYSLFNQKEKRIFPLLLLSMMILSISAISAMIPKYYRVEFYDQNDQELFVHEFKEGEKINLEAYQPQDADDTFYGWALKKDSISIHHEISEIENDFKLYAVWGRYEERVVDKELDYKEIKKDDDSILKGEEKLQQQGEKGLKQFTYQEFLVGDKVIEKELLEEKILKEPKDKILLVGTKEEIVAYENQENEPVQTQTQTVDTAEKHHGNTKKKDYSAANNHQKIKEKQNKPTKKAPFLPESKEKVLENIYLVNGEYRVDLIPNTFNDRFKNCEQLRTVYPYGVDKYHPAYKNYPRGDADKDGWACEVRGTPGGFYEGN